MQTVSSAPWPDWADLLGRSAGSPSPSSIPAVTGRRVLVTGAGGLIGSEMVRLFAASGAERIVLLEVAEQKLFEIQDELNARGLGERIIPVLGSVCDGALLDAVWREHRPAIVLHAAALKHVPLMERNPLAAVATNSLGTWELAQAAGRHGVHQMVFVSTDKAVAPRSIMGASKRIAELVMLEAPLPATTVRLVNVIGSPCSVGPLFAEQIARGGPVTVTDPAARRFFLTLGEVVALLGQAIEAGKPGILIPEAGEPLLIAELARRMMGERQLEIRYAGLRPGDKLDESLAGTGECRGGQASAGLWRIESPGMPELPQRIGELERAVAERDMAGLLEAVQDLVPDYEPGELLLRAALRTAGVRR